MPPFVLGAYTKDGDLRDEPVYEIGKVIKKGQNLPSKQYYADDKGHYNLVRYIEKIIAIYSLASIPMPLDSFAPTSQQRLIMSLCSAKLASGFVALNLKSPIKQSFV